LTVTVAGVRSKIHQQQEQTVNFDWALIIHGVQNNKASASTESSASLSSVSSLARREQSEEPCRRL
jgi:hypothetical protein